MQNSALAGFSLGSKMSAISALGGKGAGEKDTAIQNFSANVHATPRAREPTTLTWSFPRLAR